MPPAQPPPQWGFRVPPQGEPNIRQYLNVVNYMLGGRIKNIEVTLQKLLSFAPTTLKMIHNSIVREQSEFHSKVTREIDGMSNCIGIMRLQQTIQSENTAKDIGELKRAMDKELQEQRSWLQATLVEHGTGLNQFARKMEDGEKAIRIDLDTKMNILKKETQAIRASIERNGVLLETLSQDFADQSLASGNSTQLLVETVRALDSRMGQSMEAIKKFKRARSYEDRSDAIDDVAPAKEGRRPPTMTTRAATRKAARQKAKRRPTNRQQARKS
ncbi:hypothetical protein PWT90_10505 [Aphanocladium album]|nr:hypothetical protein PWT90_10505 [Aphanocladium album]